MTTGPGAAQWARQPRPTDYKRPRICYCPRAPHLSTGRQENRHCKGADAQQQGKEETEGRQEPQEGRRDAVAVLVRKNADAGRPKPLRLEELRLALFSPTRLRLGHRRRRRHGPPQLLWPVIHAAAL